MTILNVMAISLIRLQSYGYFLIGQMNGENYCGVGIFFVYWSLGRQGFCILALQ